MSFYSANATERADMVRGLRELADFLDANPECPAPVRLDIQLSTYGETMADRMESVDQFAQLADVGTGWWDDAKTHYAAERQFGRLKFFCIAIDRSKDES